MKNKINTNNGITLIALIVTIIVLLILAGVTVATLTGENGLLSKAQIAKERNQESEQDEKDRLSSYENEINNYSTWERTGGQTETTIKSNINYSTEEQDTGLKWINGETIYQKTVYGNVTATGDFNIPHGISNIGDYRTVDYAGSYLKNGTSMWPLPCVSNTWDYVQFVARIDATNIVMSGGKNRIGEVYITIRYTKTANTEQSE